MSQRFHQVESPVGAHTVVVVRRAHATHRKREAPTGSPPGWGPSDRRNAPRGDRRLYPAQIGERPLRVVSRRTDAAREACIDGAVARSANMSGQATASKAAIGMFLDCMAGKGFAPADGAR